MKVRFLPDNREYEFYQSKTILQAARELGLDADAPCGGRGKCGKCLVEADGRKTLACQTSLQDGMVINLTSGRKGTIVLSSGTETEVAMNPLVRAPYHAAIDIGTTTLACEILEGESGRILASAGALNPQQTFGADVVSRIQAAMNGQMAALTKMIREALSRLLSQSAKQAGVSVNDIGIIGIVGNPCMQQLFEGISLENLARPPFPAKLGKANVLPAGEIFPELPNALVLSVPDVFGYIGADTMGCVLSSGIHRTNQPSLLVDIGTNGEMVLSDGGRMVACATAAGPALEGAGITFGMRGSAGAIDHVSLKDGRISCHVIREPARSDGEELCKTKTTDTMLNERKERKTAGSEFAVESGGETICHADGARCPEVSGICGSGLIDAVALLWIQGIINRRGRLPAPEDCPAFAQYLGEKDGERIFHLTDSVYLTQEDIRQVQMAKGAIAAGIELMAKELQIEIRDIRNVYLAGAFGSFIRKESACAIGLLPPELAGCVHVIGNAAIEGCRRMVCSQEEFYLAETLSRNIQALDLASVQGFARSYAKHMGF